MQFKNDGGTHQPQPVKEDKNKSHKAGYETENQ